MNKWVCLGLVLSLTVACGRRGDDDDDNNTVLPIYGSFEVIARNIAGAPFEFPIHNHSIWVRFETDNTYYVLEETALGFRNVEDGVFSATETQVNMDGALLNYTVNDDEIYLTHPEYTVDILRNAATPEVVDWTGLITIDANVQNVRAANESDLAWNGTNLLYGHYTTRELIEYDFTTGSEISALVTNNSLIGVGIESGNVWTSSNGSDSIFLVEAGTGLNVVTSVPMGAWIYGIAYDGANTMWTVSGNERTIYEFDPTLNVVTNSTDVSELPFGGLLGMEYVDGDLYIISANAVYRCQPSPFQVLQTFLIDDLEFANASGLAHNGTSFYGYRYDYETQQGVIARLLFSQ